MSSIALKGQIFEDSAQFGVAQELVGSRPLPGVGMSVKPVEFQVRQQIVERHMACQGAALARRAAGCGSWPAALSVKIDRSKPSTIRLR